MLLEMSTQEMINHLGLMTEDEGHVRNPELIKQRALNNATLALAQMLVNQLLEELKDEDLNQELVSGAFPLSSLSYSVLRSGAGILKVKIKDGRWCTKMELEDIKVTEHPSLAGSTRNPLFYIHKNEIVVSAGAATHIDIYYIRNPNPLLYAFTMAAHSADKTTKFIGALGEGLSTDEAVRTYVGAVISCLSKKSYHVVTAYDADGGSGSTPLFTVTPAAGTDFGADTFYLTTSPYKIDGLDNHFCELSPSLHPLVLIQAETELWARDKALDRKNAAEKKVKDEVAILNARYEPSPGIGRRKPEGGE